jgi:SAM-dependent methyltransferase
VLDLGAGYCEFINNATAGVKYAMDLNPDVQKRATQGVTVLQQDCSEPWPLPEGELDAVFTSNFLEHLPNKAAVSTVLSNAYRCLKPGGRFIAMGPNIKYLPGAYWDFFDHHVELTELSLAEALSNCDFGIETQVARFLPYTYVARTPVSGVGVAAISRHARSLADIWKAVLGSRPKTLENSDSGPRRSNGTRQ